LQKVQTLLEETIQRRLVRPVGPGVVAADARRIAGTLSAEQVDALLAGGDPTTVVTGRRARREAAVAQTSAAALTNTTANALGDAESELLFVPVSPCRIIDTRKAGGVIPPGTIRAFDVVGSTNFAAQGGKEGGCGLPEGASVPVAAAAVINFVAVGPAGPGHLEAWEFGQPIPTASVINYSNVPGLNIANGVVVPIAGVATLEKDLNVRANVNGTHVVADVTGYFTRFPIEQFQGNVKSELVNNDFTTLINMSDGACHELNTCTIITPAATPGTVVVEAWGQFVVGHTSGTLDRVAIGVETINPVTCSYIPDSADASDYEVSPALGSNSDVDFTVAHGRAFAQPGGTTRTYRLSGLMLNGAGTGDAVENSRIICTFIPD
jgi:hypothetical protein